MFHILTMGKSFCIALITCLIMSFTVRTSQAQIGGGYYVIPPSWSPDGSRIALVVGNDIEVRDAATTDLLYMLSGHTDFIPMVAWSPDSGMIAAPSYDQTVKVWNMADGMLLHTLVGHNEAVTAIAWSRDGTRLLSWGFDTRPNLYVWDATTGALLARHNSGSIVAAAFSPDGQRFALSAIGVIGVNDALTLKPIAHSPRVMCCPNNMYSIAWSPDGARLVTGSINGLVTLWDTSTAQMLAQFVANPHYEADSRDVDNLALSWVRDVTFGPERRTVLSVSGDGTVREWEVASRALVQEAHLMPLAGAAWSLYSGRLAVTDLTTREGGILGDEQAFDARALAGRLHIVVPFATSERLRALAEGCGAPGAAAQVLVRQAQAGDRTGFEEALRALALPPGCAADVRAVAEAIPRP